MSGFAHIEVRPNGDVVLVDSFSGVSGGGGTGGGSGTVDESDINLYDVLTDNATTSRHGFLRKLSGNATDYLDGTGNWSVPTLTLSTITEAQISLSDVTTDNASTTKHGFLPKLSGLSGTWLNGMGQWAAISGLTEAELQFSDVTTNNSTTSRHGLLKKLSGTATEYMDGSGAWSVPPTGVTGVSEANISLSDVTTDDVTTSRHGFAPKAPNDTTKFLRGDGTWAVVGVSGISGLVNDTLWAAKGDLVVGLTDNTAQILSVGATNGYLLTVDSAQTLGVKWGAPPSGNTGLTKQITIPLTIPDSSGNAYSALVSTSNIRELFPAYLKDVDGDWWGILRVPQDYSSAGAIILRIGANSTAGQVTSFIVSTKVRDTAATWDAALTAETVQDLTLQTTAYRPSDLTFTLSTTPVAGSDLIIRIQHNGTRGADTLAVDTILMQAVFQYTT